MITFLISLALFTTIEQHIQDKNSQLGIEQFDLKRINNLLLMKHLLKSNQAKLSEIKNYEDNGDLVTQKLYYSSEENSFNNF